MMNKILIFCTMLLCAGCCLFPKQGIPFTPPNQEATQSLTRSLFVSMRVNSEIAFASHARIYLVKKGLDDSVANELEALIRKHRSLIYVDKKNEADYVVTISMNEDDQNINSIITVKSKHGDAELIKEVFSKQQFK